MIAVEEERGTTSTVEEMNIMEIPCGSEISAKDKTFRYELRRNGKVVYRHRHRQEIFDRNG